LVVCASTSASAREWTPRSGTGTLEAELIDAGDDHVILKRTSDGKLFKVPLSRLSLGDVHYVREAMKAAGMATDEDAVPKADPAKSPDAKDAKPAPVTPDSAPGTTAKPAGPPLAVAGSADWQVAPDPVPLDWSLPPDAKIKIPVTSGRGRDDVVFAGLGSPFVALGLNDRDCVRELWDLRTSKRIGVIRDEISGISKLAISPDGQYMAVSSFRTRGRIEIWSFRTGKMERQLELGQQFSSVYGLDFVGPNRIAVALSNEKAIVVWDIDSDQRVAKIDIYPVPEQNAYAISTGGNYLAAVKNNERIHIFDLRNGVIAGDLAVRSDGGVGYQPVRTVAFSGDGEELAVLIERNQTALLRCWSMKDGEVVAEHQLDDQFRPRSPSSRTSRTLAIDWLPGKRGWLLYGVALVDREKGGPVWVAKDERFSSNATLRRAVDENRMLVVSGGRGTRCVELADIPWNVITESQRIVEAGGTVDDVGLPNVTVPDWSAVERKSLVASSSKYEPVETGDAVSQTLGNSVHVDTRAARIKRAMCAASDPTRLLISCDAPAVQLQRPTLLSSTAGQYQDVYDLSTGKHLYRFEIPFATEFLDLSPTAKYGVFRENKKKDRLDVYELETGRHAVGFRPNQNNEQRLMRHVNFAAFVDDDHLLTVGQDGQLALWNLEKCQPVYSLPLATGSNVFMDESRKYFATLSGGVIHLVDAISGNSCTRLLMPKSKGPAVLSALAFRHDGRRLAGLLYQKGARRLVAWNTDESEAICDITIPYESFRLSWTGPDHVALHDTQSSEDTARGRRHMTLVDVPAQRVVWAYKLGSGTTCVDGPDDRFWVFAVDGNTLSRRLCAFDLPDPKAAELIAAAPAPKPVFGNETRVALKIHLGAMPDGLEDRREREDQMEQDLREHFVDALNAQGVTVDQSAPVTFAVSMKTLTKDDVLSIRSRYRLGRRATIVLSTSAVRARMSIQVGDELVLWEESKFAESSEVESSRAPRGMALSTFIHLGQWELARRWCLETPLPGPLYHLDAYRGVGESSLDASGVRFLRRCQPAPTIDGKRDRTAFYLNPTRWSTTL